MLQLIPQWTEAGLVEFVETTKTKENDLCEKKQSTRFPEAPKLRFEKSGRDRNSTEISVQGHPVAEH